MSPSEVGQSVSSELGLGREETVQLLALSEAGRRLGERLVWAFCIGWALLTEAKVLANWLSAPIWLSLAGESGEAGD